MKYFGLTTTDNPYNVFTDYINWMNYDHQKGYNTSELLARIARTSDELSEEENQAELEHAIDSIIDMHPKVDVDDGEEAEPITYVKVVREM